MRLTLPHGCHEPAGWGGTERHGAGDGGIKLPWAVHRIRGKFASRKGFRASGLRLFDSRRLHSAPRRLRRGIVTQAGGSIGHRDGAHCAPPDLRAQVRVAQRHLERRVARGRRSRPLAGRRARAAAIAALKAVREIYAYALFSPCAAGPRPRRVVSSELRPLTGRRNVARRSRIGGLDVLRPRNCCYPLG